MGNDSIPAPSSENRPPPGGQVVGNIQGPEGRLVVVRIGNVKAAASGNTEQQATGANDLGRFCVDGTAYVVRREGQAEEPAIGDLSRLLTERELEVAALIATGRLNKQIAAQLRISEHTVSSYLNRIFSKLRVHNRSAVAAQYALWASSLPHS